MKTIQSVAIIGLGALGSAYASKLYDMDPSALVVVADPERAGRYQRQGILINGKQYDFSFVSPSEASKPVDLIIVAVKAHHLAQAVSDIKNLVGDHTIILSLLNGITSEAVIGDTYGQDKVLYALSFALTPNREGNQVRFNGYGNLAFGEANNIVYSDKVLAVKELFDRAGIPYSIPEDMLRALWWKFMVNVGINQCSAVTRGRYRLFQTDRDAQALMEAAMREVILLSDKAGVGLNQTDIDRWYDVLLSLDPDSRTSMLEDIESGRKTEVEIFAGTVCALGQTYGVDTPVNQTLLRVITLIEKQEASKQQSGGKPT